MLTGGFAGGELSSSRRGLGQGFCVYRDPDTQQTPGRKLTSYAAAFLEENREKPLFLFVNYFDPHTPYAAPPRFRRRFQADRKREAVSGGEGPSKAFAGDLINLSLLSKHQGPLTGPALEAVHRRGRRALPAGSASPRLA